MLTTFICLYNRGGHWKDKIWRLNFVATYFVCYLTAGICYFGYTVINDILRQVRGIDWDMAAVLSDVFDTNGNLQR